MTEIYNLLLQVWNYVPALKSLILLVIAFVLFNFLITYFKRKLLKNAKTKKGRSNIEIFSRILKYALVTVLLMLALFGFVDDWTNLGVTVGLFSAALGWALQKPITGMAAWIMIVIKRPFAIGDRIIIGTVKGDVKDITLTHIYLKEIGGLIASEENSGRIILVPNSILFEQNIVNYTLTDDFVLDQVVTSLTYESNLDKAEKIALKAAKKHLKEFEKQTKGKEPYSRTYFQPSGINLHVRYFAPATRLQEFSSYITKEVYNKISKEKDIEFAYPHTEVVFKKDTKIK